MNRIQFFMNNSWSNIESSTHLIVEPNMFLLLPHHGLLDAGSHHPSLAERCAGISSHPPVLGAAETPLMRHWPEQGHTQLRRIHCLFATPCDSSPAREGNVTARPIETPLVHKGRAPHILHDQHGRVGLQARAKNLLDSKSAMLLHGVARTTMYSMTSVGGLVCRHAPKNLLDPIPTIHLHEAARTPMYSMTSVGGLVCRHAPKNLLDPIPTIHLHGAARTPMYSMTSMGGLVCRHAP